MVGPRATEDHYAVLGVNAGASALEVKQAYRALSRVCHPDKVAHLGLVEQQEHERRMKALNCAYSVLMSPRQRRTYDLSFPTMSSADNPQQPVSRPPAAAAACQRDGLFAWKQRREARQNAGGQRSPSPGPNTEPSAADQATASAAASAGTERSARNVAFPSARPRYHSGGKYSSSVRQARRMDPSQYTQHLDGRAAEFSGGAAATAAAASAGAMPPPGQPKPPMWLQREMDVAKKWEEIHCAAGPEERPYQWANACGSWLDRLKEKRQARESEHAEATAAC